MSTSIGLRIYKISVKARGEAVPLPLDSGALRASVPDFVGKFIGTHASATQNSERERSWYFESRVSSVPSNKGYVHYGTFGFESNFVDAKTKKKNYRRRTTDVEEIPLFYEFWFPAGEFFGLVAFQSFQGRSCISLVTDAMRESFEAQNPQYMLMLHKVQPGDARNSAYFSSPVKKLRLIKRKVSGDIAEKYFDGAAAEPVDFEVVISARRRKSLGTLSSLFASAEKGGGGVFVYDGMEFPEAMAEVQVGERTRRVGVLGFNGDAGVIDLTDAIERGSDGHPTFASLEREADMLLTDFYLTLSGTAA